MEWRDETSIEGFCWYVPFDDDDDDGHGSMEEDIHGTSHRASPFVYVYVCLL